MLRFKRDPLEDPVVMAWDAYVAGDPSGGARSSQQTFALIETLNSAMADVDPDSDFLASLERKLLGFNVQPFAAVAAPVGPVSRPVPPSKPPVLRRFGAIGQPSHWAIAALLVLFLAGAAVLAWSKQDEPDGLQSIPAAIDSAASGFSSEATPSPGAPPASPVASTGSQPAVNLLNIQVSPAELDAQTSDTWDVMEFSLVTVKTGESFTTDHPWFTAGVGLTTLQVREGSASFVVHGPADLYAAGSGQTPVRIPAGNLFALESGESAVFAIESPAIVTNTGSGDLLMLAGYANEFIGPMTSVIPDDYHNEPMALYSGLDSIPAETVDVSFEQVALEPGEFTHVESRADEWLAGLILETDAIVLRADGELDALPTDPADSFTVFGSSIFFYSPGPQTFFNDGDTPATLHFMRIAPVAAESDIASPVASPVADVQAAETLLDIQVNPGDLGATTSDLWDTMEFEMVSVNAGESFNTDHPYFTCCAGISVYQILEGSASFIVESDADVYAAGEWSTPTRIPAGTLFPLGAGETAVFVMDQPAIVTNTGTEELAMLRGSGEQFLGPITSQMPDGYRGGGWATDASIDPLPGEVVNVSFERVALDPGALFHLETTAGARLVGFSPEADTRLRMLIGEFDVIPADNQGILLRSYVMGDFPPGPFTFHNAGDLPVTLYLMRIDEVAPVSPAASPVAADSGPASPVASPVAEAQPHETLLDIQVDPAELNANPLSNWDSMEFALVHVKPGESFSTDSPYFACCIGIAVFQVLEGSASFIAESDADVYAAGEWSTPTRIPAGTLFSLSPEETAVFSMEIPAVVTNTGADELVMLGAYSYFFKGPITSVPPDGYLDVPWANSSPFDPLPGDQVQVQLERIALEPGELTHVDVSEESRLIGWHREDNAEVRMTSGALDAIPDDPLGAGILSTYVMDYLPEGPYTFFNTGENPATIYLFRISPVSAGTPAASPAAADTSPRPHENLLDIQMNPAEFGAAPLSSWDGMLFELVKVNSGESFSTDHPYFWCCDGLATFQLREGSASFIVDGPADIYSGTGEQPPLRVEAGTLFALNVGETAVFAMKQPAVVTNTGPNELVMLGGYAFLFSSQGSTATTPDGYQAPTWTYLSQMNPLTGGGVEIEFERVSLAPGEYTHVEVREDERLVGWHPEPKTTVRIAPGALDTLPDGPLGSSIIHSLGYSNLSPGPYTLFNTGKNPATLHFMRIVATGAGDTAGDTTRVVASDSTEAPLVIQREGWETVLNSVFQPSSQQFGSGPDWDSSYFAEVTLDPARNDIILGCCNGVHVVTVLEGELTISLLPNPITAFTTGDAPENLSTFQAGETLVYGGTITVANQSDEPARVLIGGAYPASAPGAETLNDGLQIDALAASPFIRESLYSLVSVDIDQISIQPGESAPLSVTPDDALLLLATAEGAQVIDEDGAKIVDLTTAFGADELETGEYRLTNTSAEPITVYTLRIGPDLAPPSS